MRYCLYNMDIRRNMKEYNAQQIEAKWQQIWEEKQAFRAVDFDKRPKYYSLIEFPYPSGAGLHVGHVRAYTSLEVVSRMRRMQGYNVLFPIGWDAFGLPTENYAIKTGQHPRAVTDNNIKTFLSQLKRVGYSFDYDRQVDTTDSAYYKWTQWIFLQLYKRGLAYRSHTYVNFCPTCMVVLSNEESQGGVCDRCGTQVEQRVKDVWFLKIRAYADKLLDGLDGLDFFRAVAGRWTRVLRPGGHFLYVVPGEKHLWEMKQVLYEKPYPNEAQETPYEGFRYVDIRHVETAITLENQADIHALFQMTPYYWKTPKAGADRLAALDSLTTTIAFDVHVFERK